MFTFKTPLFFIACLGIFFASCHECPPVEACPPEGYELVKITEPNVIPTIDSTTAANWTTEWRSKMSANGGFLTNNPVQAFEIPHDDIAAVITHAKARVYLAYNDDIGANTYHLVVVGVDSTGKDDTSQLYDLTVPCPRVCDTSSFLYSNSIN